MEIFASFPENDLRRTHDTLYLSENRKLSPKEYFKFIASYLKMDSMKNATVLDIGCATGDFLYYLHSINPKLNYAGLDIMHELIKKAEKNVLLLLFL